MTCLDNVIKLSRTTCNCFDDDKPNDFNVGKTEVYLDELDGLGLSLLNASSTCEEGSLWDMMAKARTNATLAFKTDLLSAIENNFVSKRPNYSGLLGQTTFTSTLPISTPYAGQVITFKPIVGAKMIVKRIGLIMNVSVPVTVSVYNNDENKTNPIGTYTINSVANSIAFGVLSTPLELPLWSKNINDLEYYFVYSISGFQPKNNKTECVPCSGGVKNVVWNNWVNLNGISGSTNDYSTFNKTETLNGLVVDAEFKCDASRIICSEEYPIDFETGRGMQMAYAIRFKAGDILLNNILSSPEINRYTMIDREALYGKRNWCRSNYQDWIKYLSENTPIINNDCWICKPNGLLKRGTIFA